MTRDPDFDAAIRLAAPSRQHLIAWPTLTQAASMLGLELTTLSRAMESRGIQKHRLGGRAKKVAPISILELAVSYGSDVAIVADDLMTIAERSGAPEQYVASVEADLGAWFAGQAMRATQPPDDELQSLVAAVRELADEDVAAAILQRAGLSGSAAAGSPPSREPQTH